MNLSVKTIAARIKPVHGFYAFLSIVFFFIGMIVVNDIHLRAQRPLSLVGPTYPTVPKFVKLDGTCKLYQFIDQVNVKNQIKECKKINVYYRQEYCGKSCMQYVMYAIHSRT